MMSRLWVVLAVGAWCAAGLPAAGADEGQFVSPVLAIRKNTNANRVEYGLRVDGRCRPKGDEPVSGYFRRLTRGPNVRRDLSFLERRAYGVQDQRVHRTSEGGHVDFIVRALPGRRLRFEVRRRQGDCKVRALMRVAGKNAELVDVYLVLRGAIDVDHVEIKGRALADNREVVEHIEP